MTPSHGGLPNGSPHQRDSSTSVRQPLRLLSEDGASRVDGLAARQRLANPHPFSAQKGEAPSLTSAALTDEGGPPILR